MACSSTDARGELAFVQSLRTRDPAVGECRGPLVRIAMMPFRVFTLEQIFDSPAAMDVLWGGHHEDGCIGVHFSLCAAHWLDLAALVWMRSRQNSSADWAAESEQLLRDLCDAAGWDPKEIVNMFAWQQSQLT